MESQETPVNPNHITEWSKEPENIEAVNMILNELQNPNVKAIIIEGMPPSGKTTLAGAIGEELLQQEAAMYFTTAAIQNSRGARAVKDRTGVTYTRLPPRNEILPDKQTIIIVDEIKGRSPSAEGQWEQYTQLPNTKFILLQQPDNSSLENWINLFPNQAVTSFSLS